MFVPNESGGYSITNRQCTKEYKIRPILKEIRKQLGIPYRHRAPKDLNVEQWLGISIDEIQRANPNQPQNPPWITMRYPLIEEGLSRYDCLEYFNERYPGRELRKSACIGCPYHSEAMWYEMATKYPDEYQDAVNVEEAINLSDAAERFDRDVRLTRMGPLKDIRWETRPKQGAFWDECGGYCHT